MSNPNLPLAVVYYRMSTDKQDTSIELQRSKVTDTFEDQYAIVDEYKDEGKSASHKTSKRLAFLKMINDVTVGKYKGKVTTILCLDSSRYDRLDTIDGAPFKSQLRNAGVKLHTVMDGVIDWNSMTGRIVDSVLSEQRAAFSRTVAEKGLQGRIKTTLRGKCNGTPIPYALAKEVISDKGDKVIVARGERFACPKSWRTRFVLGKPEEVAAVRWMFSTFDKTDLSYREIARQMDAKKFPSPSGLGWQGQAVRDMLENVHYAGDAWIGVTPKGSFYRTSNGQETKAADAVKSPPVIAWGKHEAIIDRDLFDRVQTKSNRIHAKKRSICRKKGTFPLSGILFCGNCGSRMTAENNKGYVLYRCMHASTTPAKGCGYWLVRESTVLPVIIERLKKEIDSGSLTPRPKFVEAEKQKSKLEQKVSAMEKKLTQARERFLAAPVEATQGLAGVLATWEREREELQRQIAACKPDDEVDQFFAFMRQLKEEIAQNAHEWVELVEETETTIKRRNKPAYIMRGRVKNPVHASVLREQLKRLGVRVDLWFQRTSGDRSKSGKGKWMIDRVRLRAEIGGQVVNECLSVDQHSQVWRCRPAAPVGKRRPLMSTSSRLPDSPCTMKSRLFSDVSPTEARCDSLTAT